MFRDVEEQLPAAMVESLVDGDGTATRKLVDAVGEAVLFLVTHSSGLDRPFVRIGHLVRDSDVLQRQQWAGSRMAVLVDRASNFLARPVHGEVVSMLLGKFDGFTRFVDVVRHVPLRRSLTEAITKSLHEYQLVERPVCIPHPVEESACPAAQWDFCRRFDGARSLEELCVLTGTTYDDALRIIASPRIVVERLSWAAERRLSAR